MYVTSQAPVRVSFGGGGSDVPPYCWSHGGEVLNTTIDRFARATLRPKRDEITIRSVDFDIVETFDTGRIAYDGGDLELLKAVLNQFDLREGFELTVQSDLPSGTGLGGSSSVAVAVVGCLAAFLEREMTPDDAAELAYYAEREDLGEKGGYQDQYAAAHGGFNDITFADGETEVRPVTLPDPLLSTLERRLLLYYTGETRASSEIHEDMDRQYREDPSEERARRRRLKQVAVDMNDALANGDINRFGELLHDGWTVKKELSKMITIPVIDEIYETSRQHGAAGGKILGAGGGGHLLLLAEPGRTMDVRYALREFDIESVPFGFEADGLQTWVSDDAK